MNGVKTLSADLYNLTVRIPKTKAKNTANPIPTHKLFVCHQLALTNSRSVARESNTLNSILPNNPPPMHPDTNREKLKNKNTKQKAMRPQIPQTGAYNAQFSFFNNVHSLCCKQRHAYKFEKKARVRQMEYKTFLGFQKNTMEIIQQ